jgi:hypothetical protein
MDLKHRGQTQHFGAKTGTICIGWIQNILKKTKRVATNQEPWSSYYDYERDTIYQCSCVCVCVCLYISVCMYVSLL